MRAIRWTLLLLAAVSIATAWGQTLDLSLARGAEARVDAELALIGLREGDATADLRLGVMTDAYDVAALLGARWSRSTTLGLLGAVTVELDGALRTDGHVRLRLGGRGVLGPASVGVDLAARSADAERFFVAGIAPLSEEPRLPGTVWSTALDVRYRIDRQLLLGLEPGVYGSAAGLAARLDGSLRVRRWSGEFDALATWHGWVDPVTGGVAAGLGAGVVWAPRRAPEWRATLWLGLAEGAVTPGLAVRGRADVATGVGVDISVAAQPFRRDVPPYRAFAEVTVDVAASELYVRAQAQADRGAAPFAAALTVGGRIPLGAR